MANDTNTKPTLTALPSQREYTQEDAYRALFREITRGIEPNFVRNERKHRLHVVDSQA